MSPHPIPETRPERIWIFDTNRRVYPEVKPGESQISRSPIWREHWRELRIVDETSRSWISHLGARYPKRRRPGSLTRSYCISQEEIDDEVWARAHRHKIVRKIDLDASTEELRRIATLIGYKEENQS